MLTDERKLELWNAGDFDDSTQGRVIRFARAIEAEVRAEAQGPVELCDAPAVGGLCCLPRGHTRGNLDIPQNHKTAPQPTATCQGECGEYQQSYLEARSALTEQNKRLSALQAKVAELEGKNSGFSVLADVMQTSLEDDTDRISELLDQVAEQSAEIERLTNEVAVQACWGPRWGQAQATIAQQAERIAALESDNKAAWATADRHLKERSEARERIAELEEQLETERVRLAACGVVALANTPDSAARSRQMLPKYRSGSLDSVEHAVDSEMHLRSKVEQQAALIEKCEKALIEARDDVYSELMRAKQSAGYKRYDDEIKRQMAQLVRHDEALAAIAAQKGGA